MRGRAMKTKSGSTHAKQYVDSAPCKFLRDTDLRRGPILTFEATHPANLCNMEYVHWHRKIIKFAQDSPFYQTRVPSVPLPLKCSSRMSRKRKRGIRDLQDRIVNSHSVIPRKVLKAASFLKTESTSIDATTGGSTRTRTLDDFFPEEQPQKQQSYSFHEGQDDAINLVPQDEDMDEFDAGDYTRNYNQSDDEGDVAS
eukprot:g7747.t1